jgi:hypothetical protein
MFQSNQGSCLCIYIHTGEAFKSTDRGRAIMSFDFQHWCSHVAISTFYHTSSDNEQLLLIAMMSFSEDCGFRNQSSTSHKALKQGGKGLKRESNNLILCCISKAIKKNKGKRRNVTPTHTHTQEKRKLLWRLASGSSIRFADKLWPRT